MLRHREVQVLLLWMSLLSIVLVIVGASIGSLTALLVAGACGLYGAAFMLFTRHRYKQISLLAEYLRRVSLGEHALDIRDNTEGELSILRSEIYKVTVMLSEYNQQLHREKLLLSTQMADISHQLKTPLTSMMMMVELFNYNELSSDKRREFALHLRKQLERLEWLVSSLLKMSKLDAGVVEMKPTEVVAKDLMDSALRPLLIPLELKEITWSTQGDGHVIVCDLHWTTEAIINILKNCIEHTPVGGRIDIFVSNNPLYTEICIKDTGSGIDKRDLPHIFTRFYRGRNASPDSIGIGLAMSRSIILAQHGDVTVESLTGHGSSFFVRFYKVTI